ncbi:LysE family translocator [Stappia sp. ES.058]|uniref:LysE family translocator n=1 Tax=Stappia sp. ES.058 TaxID=1881061 RepID=UPI00087BB74D|nr:LysE family transporter [Stappia sp. ES.058]SDU18158.1 Threonine/homoserine/homoserine lactone efflux protein [Stappia sp. ES.058]
MVPSTELATALGIQAVAMLVPGPNQFLLLTLSQRRPATRLSAVVGIATAGLVFSSGACTAIYFAGEATSERVFLLLNVLGSLYLIYLGARMLIDMVAPGRQPLVEQRIDEAPAARWHAFPSGFLVNIANPKSAVFFGSVFATTLPLAAMTPSDYVLVVLLFFVNSVIVHGGVSQAFALPGLQHVLRARRRLIASGSALVFLAFGLTTLAHVGLRLTR